MIVKDSVFATGPECGPAIAFARNGSRIVVTGNICKGSGREIRLDPSCTDATSRDNFGVLGK